MSFDLTGKAVKILRLPTVEYNKEFINVVPTQQGDVNSRYFVATLYDDRGDIDLSSYDLVTLNATLPDGTLQFYTGDIDKETNTLVIQIPSSMMEQKGNSVCNLMVRSSADDVVLLTSQTFYLFTMKSQGGENAEEAGNDDTSVAAKIFEYAESAEKNAQIAEDCAQKAITSAEEAVAAKADASVSAVNAAESESKALEYAQAASLAANSAETKAGDAEQAAEKAALSEANSKQSEDAAKQSETNAEQYASDSLDAKTSAQEAANSAGDSADKALQHSLNAEDSKTAAEQSAQSAAVSEENALTYQQNAEKAATEADEYKQQAGLSAQEAAVSEGNAKASETAAAESEANTYNYYQKSLLTQLYYSDKPHDNSAFITSYFTPQPSEFEDSEIVAVTEDGYVCRFKYNSVSDEWEIIDDTEGGFEPINLNGVGIVSITANGQNSAGGNIYKITMSDGKTTNITAPKGDKGEQGEPFNPKQWYESVEAMQADFNNSDIDVGDIVVIEGSLDIYVKGDTMWQHKGSMKGTDGDLNAFVDEDAGLVFYTIDVDEPNDEPVEELTVEQLKSDLITGKTVVAKAAGLATTKYVHKCKVVGTSSDGYEIKAYLDLYSNSTTLINSFSLLYQNVLAQQINDEDVGCFGYAAKPNQSGAYDEVCPIYAFSAASASGQTITFYTWGSADSAIQFVTIDFASSANLQIKDLIIQ